MVQVVKKFKFSDQAAQQLQHPEVLLHKQIVAFVYDLQADVEKGLHTTNFVHAKKSPSKTVTRGITVRAVLRAADFSRRVSEKSAFCSATTL